MSDIASREPEDLPAPTFINGRPLVFFRTYVGAAAAVQLGFLSLDGLEAVVDAAIDKLKDVADDSDKWTDFNRDLEHANRILNQSSAADS